jgi:hypothetical protein
VHSRACSRTVWSESPHLALVNQYRIGVGEESATYREEFLGRPVLRHQQSMCASRCANCPISHAFTDKPSPSYHRIGTGCAYGMERTFPTVRDV